MSYPTDLAPPIHRKFDEDLAIEYIRNRYENLQEDISKQVEMLKNSPEFRNICQIFYEKGYKDWVILSAIFNLMLNLQANAMRLEPQSKEFISELERIRGNIRNKVYEVNIFLKKDFNLFFNIHSITALKTYGFDLRRIDYDPENVEKFLRERMRHFEYDLQHAPIFGEPPGEWPLTKTV